MKELYWIDGYNLLFYLDPTVKLEAARDKLLVVLNEMVSKAGIDAIVVFDGAQEFRRGNYDCLEVIYTPSGQTADDYILEDIEARNLKGSLFVVTNDRHLAKSAALLRAQNLKLSLFLKMLLKKKAKKRVKKPSTFSTPIKIVDREFERFLKLFEERLEQYEKEDPL